MLSEDHLLRANSFLGIYAEALNTLKDIAVKSSHNNNSRVLYDEINNSVNKKHLSFDANGNLVKGAGFGASYWTRLNDLSEQHVLKKVNSSSGYNDFFKSLQNIQKDLELEITKLKLSQNS